MKAIKNYIYLNSNFVWNNLYRLNKKQAECLVYGLANRGFSGLAWNIADHCSSDFCDELLASCFYYSEGRHKAQRRREQSNLKKGILSIIL